MLKLVQRDQLQLAPKQCKLMIATNFIRIFVFASYQLPAMINLLRAASGRKFVISKPRSAVRKVQVGD